MVVENPADVEDVKKRSFRPLTSAEQTTATTLIEDAWYLLIGYRPIVVEKLSDETDPEYGAFKHNVTRLLANSVLRVINNPDGVFEEQGDDYRYRRDQAVSSGRLYFLNEEVAELLPTGTDGAFTIRPARVPGARAALPDDAYWDTLNQYGSRY